MNLGRSGTAHSRSRRLFIVLVVTAGVLALSANSFASVTIARTKVSRDPYKNTSSNHKTEVAVNWGIAAVVYYLAGSIIARFIARAGARAAY